jgi:anti-anti-sigma regulatory factor
MSSFQTVGFGLRPTCVRVLRDPDGVIVLDLEGEIDMATATDFQAAMLQSIADGARRLVVDATKVTFIDSTGGLLTISCSEKVALVMEMARFDAVFTLHATRAGAVHEVRS